MKVHAEAATNERKNTPSQSKQLGSSSKETEPTEFFVFSIKTLAQNPVHKLGHSMAFAVLSIFELKGDSKWGLRVNQGLPPTSHSTI